MYPTLQCSQNLCSGKQFNKYCMMHMHVISMSLYEGWFYKHVCLLFENIVILTSKIYLLLGYCKLITDKF